MKTKNIIITGASKGIGFQLAQLLSTANHNIIAISRDIKTLSGLKNVTPLQMDISKFEEEKFQSTIQDKFDNKIDILVNNAGKVLLKPFEEITDTEWLEVYHVNVFGLVKCTRYSMPYMQEGSQVLNISSMGGIERSSKFPGLSAYSSSKGAVTILTELLAEEFKEKGIIVNGLALGAVQTEMLESAFPGYQAPTSAKEMAEFIQDFILVNYKMFNGKILPVANTTP